MRETDRLIEELKRELKAQGLTYRELGRRIGLSESSLKRTFSSRSFTLARLERICGEAGVTVYDVARRASRRTDSELPTFTLAQEKVLAANPRLGAFLYVLSSRAPLSRIQRRFKLSAAEVTRNLIALDKLGVLELKSGNRFRLLVPRKMVYAKGGPVMARLQAFRDRFFKTGFARECDYSRFFVSKLAPATIEKLRKKLDRVMDEILEESTAFEALDDRSRSVGILVGLKPMDFSTIAALER